MQYLFPKNDPGEALLDIVQQKRYCPAKKLIRDGG